MANLQLRDVAINPETLKKLNGLTSRLAAKDPQIWGGAAAETAAIRLNWIDLPSSSRALLPELDALSAWARSEGLSNVILAGMGGSSLAPEVIAKTFKKKLTVLDTTDPDQLAAAIPSSVEELRKTVVSVGSKSGSTIETASHKALFDEIFSVAGLKPTDHIVIVTDPDSPFDVSARKDGYRVINADPNVGGRYSALSAFGLVPAALIGVDVSTLLDDAHAASQKYVEESSDPVRLAAALFDAQEQNVAFFDSDSDVPGLSDWIEQLIAESTGKNQVGRLPIVIESASALVAGPGLTIGFTSTGTSDISVSAPLGEQFILWEWVTALLGALLEIDPFDQPNVTEAKERTSALLAQWGGNDIPAQSAVWEDEDFAIFSTQQVGSIEDALSNFIALTKNAAHYYAVMAYLARGINDEVTELRSELARISGRATTFGWGPRFLHSTGQFHKGGQQNGAFIQITGENQIDLAIPGRGFSFHTLLMAQALGDGQALSSRDFPLLRIHLKNRTRAIVRLLEAVKSL